MLFISWTTWGSQNLLSPSSTPCRALQTHIPGEAAACSTVTHLHHFCTACLSTQSPPDPPFLLSISTGCPSLQQRFPPRWTPLWVVAHYMLCTDPLLLTIANSISFPRLWASPSVQQLGSSSPLSCGVLGKESLFRSLPRLPLRLASLSYALGRSEVWLAAGGESWLGEEAGGRLLSKGECSSSAAFCRLQCLGETMMPWGVSLYFPTGKSVPPASLPGQTPPPPAPLEWHWPVPPLFLLAQQAQGPYSMMWVGPGEQKRHAGLRGAATMPLWLSLS